MGWLTDRRRRQLLAQPLPAAWQPWIEARATAYALLSDPERTRLRDLVQIFVAEKSWEGCGGLVLTDEMRVTIAAMGCITLLGRDRDMLDPFDTILVYPTDVEVPAPPPVRMRRPRVVETHGRSRGFAMHNGPLMFAWDAVESDLRAAGSGSNIVVHVFARAIDLLDHVDDGTPPFDLRGEQRAWAVTMKGAFAAQAQRADADQPTFLDDRALGSAAAYFAVASESFFDRPHDFARELPEVYEAFVVAYGLDLATRTPAGGAPYRTP